MYRFWENKAGECIIEITPNASVDGKLAYVCDMSDVYRTIAGRHHLLSHVQNWGTIDYYSDSEDVLLGEIDMQALTLSPSDKSILNRTIEKEGFEYAMFDYSDYKTVDYNIVHSAEFHVLHGALVNAKRDLQTWLALQGVE